MAVLFLYFDSMQRIESKMKFFIGPMSKNTVDTIIEYRNEYDTDIVFIPSRRQIEYSGGYVNNWTTEDFCRYVRSTSAKPMLIERDHGGPGQGYTDDDGFTSLEYDVNNMDIIHIDPWKKYPVYKDGLQWTIKMMEFCYKIKSTIYFEIGTEESIRPFSVDELSMFLKDITENVSQDICKQIKYVVIQCGTKLAAKENIGQFSSDTLRSMLEVVKKYGYEAKEHNGDWVSMETINQKAACGLENINIAPEFGEVETDCILQRVRGTEEFDKLFTICHRSNRWVKWVSPSFDPFSNKELLIRICGHYIFSDPEFVTLKTKLHDIDIDIKKAIKNKLHRLQGIYYERESCLMCKGKDFETFFVKDYDTPLSFSMYTTKKPSYFMPFNILHCNVCKTVQTKYLGNPAIIYEVNHIDAFGSVKKNMHDLFSKFILENKEITGIVEVGASTDTLARCILETASLSYTIIDPDFRGDTTNIKVVPRLLENMSLSDVSGNTIVMSNLYEHLYDPVGTLQKLYTEGVEYIYLNNPDLEGGCRSNTYIILNTEHIYYIENEFLYKLFDANGFTLLSKENYSTHSIFMKFQRKPMVEPLRLIQNTSSYEDTKQYFSTMMRRIDVLNKLFENPNRKYYMWPCATYNIVLFVNGLNYTKLAGMLDNSPNKIGQKLYGYDVTCFDFKEIINSEDDTITVILGGSSDYRNELALSAKKVEILLLDSM